MPNDFGCSEQRTEQGSKALGDPIHPWPMAPLGQADLARVAEIGIKDGALLRCENRVNDVQGGFVVKPKRPVIEVGCMPIRLAQVDTKLSGLTTFISWESTEIASLSNIYRHLTDAAGGETFRTPRDSIRPVPTG